MSSSTTNASPKFRNLCFKHKQSPKELKDKMRKNYKDKVQNCREMLMDRFRGATVEQEISNTLTEIYKNMCNFNGEIENDELEVMEELRNEFVQEELEWWLQEYERSQMENVDWSTVEENDSVICPVCQKSNFILDKNCVSCLNCKTSIKVAKTLSEIKKQIEASADKHNTVCSYQPQFSVIPEATEAHIYLLCDVCSEMNMVL